MLVSTTYFGNVAFWSTIAKSQLVRLDLIEYYQKQTFRNRTEILSANGKQALSIPVNRPNGSKSSIESITISSKDGWQKNHWKAIESAYKHAPYFWYYGEYVKKLIFNQLDFLYDFNLSILNQIIIWLDLEISLKKERCSTSFLGDSDLRVKLNSKNLNFTHQNYIQVFSDKLTFQHNLSILDVLFNLGPLTRNIITEV